MSDETETGPAGAIEADSLEELIAECITQMMASGGRMWLGFLSGTFGPDVYRFLRISDSPDSGDDSDLFGRNFSEAKQHGNRMMAARLAMARPIIRAYVIVVNMSMSVVPSDAELALESTEDAGEDATSFQYGIILGRNGDAKLYEYVDGRASWAPSAMLRESHAEEMLGLLHDHTWGRFSIR